MTAPAIKRPITPEEYLAAERASLDGKHELVDGEVYALAGASESHVIIADNISSALRAALRGRGCRSYSSDMRVRVPATGLHAYPDVSALCGERHFLDERRDTLLNPSVIVEVLSPTTERYDRGRKWAHYQRLGSLREYVLVAQDAMRVERYLRHDVGWLLTAHEAPTDLLELPSVGASIPLAAIYEDVTFPAPEGAGDAPPTG